MRKKLVVLAFTPLVFISLFSFANAQTASELQAQLNALLAQLAALQGQLQTSTGSPSAIPTAAGSAYGSCPALSHALRRGVSGSDVTGLQAFLAGDSRIYPEGTISGYFGSLTEAAVQRFQVRHAIVTSGTPDSTGYGVVGPATRAAIAGLCKTGSSAQTPPPTPQTPAYPGANCSFSGGQIASGVVQTFYSVQNAPVGSTCAAYAQSRQCINGLLSGDPQYQYGLCRNLGTACTFDGVNIAHGSAYTFFSRRNVAASESCATYSQSRTCENGTLSGSSSYQYLSCAVNAPDACSVSGVTVAHGASRTFFKQDFATSTNACNAYGQTRTCNDGVLSGDEAYTKTSCVSGRCEIDGITLPSGSSTILYFTHNIPATEQCSSYSQTRNCSNGVLTGNAAYKYASCAPVSSGSCALDNVALTSGASASFYSTTTAPAGQSCSSYKQTRTCTNGALSGTASFNRASCSDTGSCTLDGITVPHGETFMFFSARTVAFDKTCGSVSQVRLCTNGALNGSATYTYSDCDVNPPTAALPNAAQLAAALTALESLLKAALIELNSWF